MLAGVYGVMTLGHLQRNREHPQADDLQPLSLEPLDDLAHEAALNAVGLDKDEGALHPVQAPSTRRGRHFREATGAMRGWPAPNGRRRWPGSAPGCPVVGDRCLRAAAGCPEQVAVQ